MLLICKGFNAYTDFQCGFHLAHSQLRDRYPIGFQELLDANSPGVLLFFFAESKNSIGLERFVVSLRVNKKKRAMGFGPTKFGLEIKNVRIPAAGFLQN
jgi:hypothetical protein